MDDWMQVRKNFLSWSGPYASIYHYFHGPSILRSCYYNMRGWLYWPWRYVHICSLAPEDISDLPVDGICPEKEVDSEALYEADLDEQRRFSIFLKKKDICVKWLSVSLGTEWR